MKTKAIAAGVAALALGAVLIGAAGGSSPGHLHSSPTADQSAVSAPTATVAPTTTTVAPTTTAPAPAPSSAPTPSPAQTGTQPPPPGPVTAPASSAAATTTTAPPTSPPGYYPLAPQATLPATQREHVVAYCSATWTRDGHTGTMGGACAWVKANAPAGSTVTPGSVEVNVPAGTFVPANASAASTG